MSKVNILIMEMMIDLTIKNKKVMREFKNIEYGIYRENKKIQKHK